MFFPDDILLDVAVRGIVLTVVALIFVVFTIRIVGLRSLSKMTNFDFVSTVATGSLLASAATVSEWPAFIQCLVAIMFLFVAQYVLAKMRKSTDNVENVLSNKPMLLMRDGVMDEAALKSARVTKSDVIAKLRESNALSLDKVRAVVLESTGDISVLHGDTFDDRLLDNVQGFD
ncbi:DUF421 domain-containing protein [Novosphingopyxis baekryungensis]|uniref:DUF421 domain-containing protein n=1 Tax=Novosphingopyxis baekryungensis TaxID=279369 RepID=UPI0003B58088|nr:YetF domain-containing protein [Novosphingopyxis baekryungensis]